MGQLGDLIYMTRNIIYYNCIFSSIAHAIMINMYPELSYEQSWDRINFSFNNGNGLRGTITFDKNECIGAIRNENNTAINDIEKLKYLTRNIPSNLIDLAFEETFQYLLEVHKGTLVPSVTSVFAFDNSGIIMNIGDNDIEDLIWFNSDINKLIEHCREYYAMTEEQIKLTISIFKRKLLSPNQALIINKYELINVFDKNIHNESEISLNEIGIYLIN